MSLPFYFHSSRIVYMEFYAKGWRIFRNVNTSLFQHVAVCLPVDDKVWADAISPQMQAYSGGRPKRAILLDICKKKAGIAFL